jgi:hypothetical protein
MARGWESKSVEEQMANALKKPAVKSGKYLNGPDSNGFVSEDARRLADKLRSERERQKQSLNLQRENILSQKTSNPSRRTALEAALVQIESQIVAMG